MEKFQRKNEVFHTIFIITIAYQTLYNPAFSHTEKLKRLTELLHYSTDIGKTSLTNRLKEIIKKINNSIGYSWNATIEKASVIDSVTPTFVPHPETMLIRPKPSNAKLIESDFDVAIEFLEDNLEECFSWFPLRILEKAEDFTIADDLNFISPSLIKLSLLSWTSYPEVQYFLYSYMFCKMIQALMEGEDIDKEECARHWNNFITYLPNEEHSVVVESLITKFEINEDLVKLYEEKLIQPVEDKLSSLLKKF